MSQDLLPIYLRDHYAASAAGVALARRIARAEATSTELANLAQQISSDRTTLRAVMQKLGVRPNHLKNAAALFAERVARLKLNGRLYRRSPLSRVVELEALGAGIHAKRDLWLTLAKVDDTGRTGADFNGLRMLADEQLAAVGRLRAFASTTAFGTRTPQSG